MENTVADAPVNDLKAALQSEGAAHGADAPSLHDAPVADADAGKIGNDALMDVTKPEAPGFEATADRSSDAAHGAADAAHSVGEIIYSNPLPHVLILTAIVVGVATTAVGLALSVRIREAYGTIEEDELEALDDVAEFGERETAGGAA
ncbi:MAG: cation:proton antiporter subunit C [Pseudomonadota bacterium]